MWCVLKSWIYVAHCHCRKKMQVCTTIMNPCSNTSVCILRNRLLDEGLASLCSRCSCLNFNFAVADWRGDYHYPRRCEIHFCWIRSTIHVKILHCIKSTISYQTYSTWVSWHDSCNPFFYYQWFTVDSLWQSKGPRQGLDYYKSKIFILKTTTIFVECGICVYGEKTSYNNASKDEPVERIENTTILH